MAIGTLTVGVAANAARGIASLKGFRKEVKGVKHDTSIASTSLKGMTSALTRVAGPLAAAGAAYLSVRTFQTIAQDLDLVAKTAAKLDVAPVKLMGLRHAAEQTGVATQTLDNALQKMNVRIAEAANGTGEAVKVLGDLKINAKEFSALSADQQFVKIAGAMAQQTSQADKLRIATKLFEAEGAALVNTLALGETGLAKMTAESAKLSGSFSAAELAKVEKYNDEMDKLSKLIGGIGSEITINIAPIASDAINLLTEAIQYIRGKEGERTWLGAGADAVKTGWKYSPVGYLTGQYQSDAFQGLSKNFSYFSDSGSAGQLTDAEHLAGNKRVSADKFRHSTDPSDIVQRAVHNNARRAELSYGKAFNDNTVGVATKAIGAVGEGFQSLVGDLKTQGAELRKTMLGRSARGLNPLTGLAPIQMSDARREYMAGRGSKPGSDSIGRDADRINDLVDAGGSEGYMALRANQRTARLNPADKSAPKIEKNTDRSATAAEQLLDWFKNFPAPRSAGL